MNFFWISFKKSFTYRSSTIFAILGSVFYILVNMALWIYVYRYDSERMSYMVSYVILSAIISFFYSQGIFDSISGKIANGDFALDLIKPTNFMTMHYFQTLGSICYDLLVKGVVVTVIFMPLLIKSIKIYSPINIVLAVAAVILGHFLNTILYSMVGFMAFIFIEAWPFRRLLSDTIRFLSGSFIPLAIFPEWLKAVAYALPFRFMYSFPIELLMSDVNNEYVINNFAQLLLWMGILGIGLLFIVRKSINKCVVQGG